jgi:hypothetical protein
MREITELDGLTNTFVSLSSFKHNGKIFIACAVMHRVSGKMVIDSDTALERTLELDQEHWVESIAYALRDRVIRDARANATMPSIEEVYWQSMVL